MSRLLARLIYLFLLCHLVILATCRLYTFHPDETHLTFERLKRQAPPVVAADPPLVPVASTPIPPTVDRASTIAHHGHLGIATQQPWPDHWVPNAIGDRGENNSDGIRTEFDEPDEAFRTPTHVKVNHVYYEENALSKLGKPAFDYYWHELYNATLGEHFDASHNVHEFTIVDGIPIAGVKEPQELKDSYRRAVNVPIQFSFPFYGVATRNVTIATGGFCYIGENSHSWLAATQYIAPLMANFATDDDLSTILYEETKDRMIIQWQNVMLKDKRHARFTFQTSLWQNGSIWFLYKSVGEPVARVSDFHHPRKVGLSDAYLESPDSNIGSKRIIHEYHRIEIKFDRIDNMTVILLDPLPTCLDYKTCNECNSATLKDWNCTWCEATDDLHFCSDAEGKHRMNEQFHEKCAAKKDLKYCPKEGATTMTPATSTTRRPSGTTTRSKTPSSSESSAIVDVPIDAQSASSSSGTTIGLVFLAVAVVLCLGWVGYAYMNPQSPSGQCLIRYRPQRWHMPNSDVRYTASVHM